MKSVPLASFFHLCIILVFIFPSLYYFLWSFDSVLLCIILLFSQCTMTFDSVLIDNWQTHTGTSCRDYISHHPNPCSRMASVRGEFDLGFAADIGATAISCWRTEENQLFLIGSQSYISSLLSDFIVLTSNIHCWWENPYTVKKNPPTHFISEMVVWRIRTYGNGNQLSHSCKIFSPTKIEASTQGQRAKSFDQHFLLCLEL